MAGKSFVKSYVENSKSNRFAVFFVLIESGAICDGVMWIQRVHGYI